MRASRDTTNAGMLAAANLAGMALPLIALPILAQRIGPQAFGLVALAQSIGMLSVLLVDSGFNTESMRATATDCRPSPLQPLLDNALARLRIALPAALATLLAPLAMPELPLAFAAVSLLQLLGTLVFPQWWLIATGDALSLFSMQIAGRLIALAGVLLWVRSPDDALLAAFLQCGATLFSALIFIAWRMLPRLREFPGLDWHAYRELSQRALPAAGAGFLAGLSAQAPQLMLGAVAGTQSVGLYASAEKIARAAAHAIGAIDQTFIAPVARRRNDDPPGSQRLADRIVGVLLIAGTGMGTAIAIASDPLARWLFGRAFEGSGDILAVFGLWLPSFVARRAYQNLKFAAQGRIDLLGRCQYIEAVAVLILCGAGASLGGALMAAYGLLAAEACVWTLIAARHLMRKETA